MHAVAQWLVFVTELKDDQDQLIKESKNWRFRPSISCYAADVSAPIPHPKGDASQFRQCVACDTQLLAS